MQSMRCRQGNDKLHNMAKRAKFTGCKRLSGLSKSPERDLVYCNRMLPLKKGKPNNGRKMI
jgi:hypothetical protein